MLKGMQIYLNILCYVADVVKRSIFLTCKFYFLNLPLLNKNLHETYLLINKSMFFQILLKKIRKRERLIKYQFMFHSNPQLGFNHDSIISNIPKVTIWIMIGTICISDFKSVTMSNHK